MIYCYHIVVGRLVECEPSNVDDAEPLLAEKLRESTFETREGTLLMMDHRQREQKTSALKLTM